MRRRHRDGLPAPASPGAYRTPLSTLGGASITVTSDRTVVRVLARRPSGSFRGWERRDAHLKKLEAEASDPLQQSLEGALIKWPGTERGRVWAHTDFTVVELRAHHAARLASESDLERS